MDEFVVEGGEQMLEGTLVPWFGRTEFDDLEVERLGCALERLADEVLGIVDADAAEEAMPRICASREKTGRILLEDGVFEASRKVWKLGVPKEME